MSIADKHSRAVVLLSFRPTLEFLDEVISRSKPLEPNYKDWSYIGNNHTVMFFDDVKRKRLTVNSNLLEMVIEDPISIDQVNEEMSLAFANYFADSNITEFRSYGSIFFSLDISKEKYADYASAFYDRFYKIKADFTNKLADQVTDVAFIVNAVKDGFNTSVKIAPLKA